MEQRRKSRELIESLGIMMPIYSDKNDQSRKSLVDDTQPRMAVPLLPKPALTQLHMNDQAEFKIVSHMPL